MQGLDRSAKKYKIGEISSMLGISIEGLRLYEKKGIAMAQRDPETGYRYYDFLDMAALIKSRIYRSLGFSMQETADLLNEGEPENLLSYLDEREEEIQRKIVWDRMMLEYVRDCREEIGEIPKHLRRCSVSVSPGMYIVEYLHQGNLVPKGPKRDRFREWIEHSPFVQIATRYPLEAFLQRRTEIVVGLSILEKHRDFLGIDVGPPVVYQPPRRSVYTVVAEDNHQFDNSICLDHVYRYLEENDLEPAGDPFARCFLSLNKQDNYTRYRQTWIPIV